MTRPLSPAGKRETKSARASLTATPSHSSRRPERFCLNSGSHPSRAREADYGGTNGKAERQPVAPLMRAAFNGAFVLNSDYDRAKGHAALDVGQADAIAFGRPFIANPDLPHRFTFKIPLARDDMEPGTPEAQAATRITRKHIEAQATAPNSRAERAGSYRAPV